MGAGSRVLRSAAEYEKLDAPGHMWVTLLEGRHVSSDVAVVNGEPRWWRHVTGKPAGEGTFDYWWVHAEPDSDIEEIVASGYAGTSPVIRHAQSGTIGGSIIEAHLRFADQWPDLYGDGWIDALVKLYEKGIWDFSDQDPRDGYSVVLFGSNGRHYVHPPQTLIDEVGRMDSVTSVQVTFHEDWSPERHSMPPGGFRLAIVNCFHLARGEAARARLKQFFLSDATDGPSVRHR